MASWRGCQSHIPPTSSSAGWQSPRSAAQWHVLCTAFTRAPVSVENKSKAIYEKHSSETLNTKSKTIYLGTLPLIVFPNWSHTASEDWASCWHCKFCPNSSHTNCTQIKSHKSWLNLIDFIFHFNLHFPSFSPQTQRPEWKPIESLSQPSTAPCTTAQPDRSVSEQCALKTKSFNWAASKWQH